MESKLKKFILSVIEQRLLLIRQNKSKLGNNDIQLKYKCEDLKRMLQMYQTDKQVATLLTKFDTLGYDTLIRIIIPGNNGHDSQLQEYENLLEDAL